MLRTIIATIIFYPYIYQIWGLLSVFGVVCLVFLIIGFVLYSSLPTRTTLKMKEFHSLLPLPSKALGSQTLGRGVRIKEGFEKILQTMLDQTPFHRHLPLLTASLSPLQTLFTSSLFDAVIMDVIATTVSQVEQYRRLVHSLAEEEATVEQPLHVDDFNRFNSKYQSKAAVQNKIVADRLRKDGILHKGVLHGQKHLRDLIMDLKDFIDREHESKAPSKDNILVIVGREIVVCRVFDPLIEMYTKPELLNNLILNTCNRKIILQQQTLQLRKALDFNFNQFPPVFLIQQYKMQRFSMADKMKYIDLMSKYLKTAVSLLDLQTVRHEIIKEIKRRLEEDVLNEEVERYLRSLRGLMRKIEKKVKAVPMEGRIRDLYVKPTITMRSILDQYRKYQEVPALNSSLFFFIQYLEGRSDHLRCKEFLKYCLAADGYRQLIFRMNTAITDTVDPSLIDFSFQSHQRLQKEVIKIYSTMVQKSQFIKLDVSLQASFNRYMSLEEEEEDFQPDYKCVISLQRSLFSSLEDVFNDFLHSEFYFRFCSDHQRNDLDQAQPDPKSCMRVASSSALVDTMLEEVGRLTLTSVERERSVDIQRLEEVVERRLDYDEQLEDVIEEEHVPGELLNNTSKLSLIQQSIDRFLSQLDCLDVLSAIKDSSLLDTAKDQLASEIAELTKQKCRYESQEQREALMPGQCFISIKESNLKEVGRGGKAIVYFDIRIDQRHLGTGWSVLRRYNDFDLLNRKLKLKFDIVDDFEFPGKTSMMWSRVKHEMREGRMKALEKYLQKLIDNKDIGRSEAVRNFLSLTYKVDSRKDKIFNFDSDPNSPLTPFKFSLSKFGKTRKSESGLGTKMLSFLDGSHKKQAVGTDDEETSSSDSDDDYISDNDRLDTTVVKPLSQITRSFIGLILKAFDFKEDEKWLRESAALKLLDQFLASKGSPEKGLLKWTKELLTEDTVIAFLTDRFEGESSSDQVQEAVQLVYLETIQKIVGDSGSKNMLMLLDMIQCQTLNKHLLYTILDSIVALLKQSI